MRLKNVKGAEEIIKQSSYVILNPKEYSGSWNKLFLNDNKIHIEIGMGKGDFIINNALTYPDINFIGIEKFDSVIVRAVEKLNKLEKEIPNLKLIRMDALEIDEVFNHEIDCLYLNFSDPWPKNRHEKRRLSSTIFLNKYDNIFKNDNLIKIKTDNRKFFEYSLMNIVNYGYSIDDVSLDLYKDDIKDNIPTEYEKKFHKLGLPIYKLDVIKTKLDIS